MENKHVLISLSDRINSLAFLGYHIGVTKNYGLPERVTALLGKTGYRRFGGTCGLSFSTARDPNTKRSPLIL